MSANGSNAQQDEERNSEAQDEVAADVARTFDEKEIHFPIFCLTKPTHEVCTAVPTCWKMLSRAYSIGTNSLSTPTVYLAPKSVLNLRTETVLEDIEANLGKEGPWPFINSTVDKVYDFYKKHIRAADDSTSYKPFTNFTFLVVDGECVKSDPQQCIVCCDAPDYDPDDEITLKKMRVPIETAIWILTPLEQLSVTPSEALNFDGDALCSIPAFTQKEAPNAEPNEFTIATPVEARHFKQRAIALRPKKFEKMLDDERAAVLFRTSMKMVAHLHKPLEDLLRKEGGTMRLVANPSRLEDERAPGVGSPSTVEGIEEEGETRQGSGSLEE